MTNYLIYFHARYQILSFISGVHRYNYFTEEGVQASSGATRLAAPILFAPAGALPSRETAPWRGRSIVFLLAPICKHACMFLRSARDAGVGIRRGGSEKRGRQDSLRASCSLPRGRCQAEKPRPCEGALSFFCWHPFASTLAWVPTKKRLRLSSQPFLGLAERTRRSI